MVNEEKYISILKEELVPALGCTEPIALALAGAKCRQLLGSEAERIEVGCSGNIIKNVKAVVVPNCGGLKGIEAAVAVGMLAGNADADLEVLTKVTEEDVIRVKDYLKKKAVKVEHIDTEAKLEIAVRMFAGGHEAYVRLLNKHTNFVDMSKDGKVLFHKDEAPALESASLTDRSFLTVDGIVDFAENVDISLIEPTISVQIENNIRICKEGLENDWGASVGKTVLSGDMYGFMGRAEAMAAAGSDARMSGCSMPVVINSGSGNQGITVSVPVIEYAREHKVPEEKLIRALALSNLLAIHQKTEIGILSAYCGVVCAACGAGAAVTWLAGGNRKQIEETVVNTLATISGMVCDGAKPSCAGKIAVAVNAAMIAHKMAMSNKSYHSGEGLVKDDVEKTISTIGTLASVGMKDTDNVILKQMLKD